MAHIARICSNCQRVVPDGCDGAVYYIEAWGAQHPICRGRDLEFIECDGGKMCYRLVRGHGDLIQTTQAR